MKRLFIIFSSALLLAMSVGCESVQESDTIADEFYQCTKNGDFEQIINLLDEEALEATS